VAFSDMAAAAISMQQSLLATNVQIAVLKKTMEIESQGVLKLLEGVAVTASNAPHLGNLVDTSA